MKRYLYFFEQLVHLCLNGDASDSDKSETKS